jgi:hypothetical protein
MARPQSAMVKLGLNRGYQVKLRLTGNSIMDNLGKANGLARL